MGDAGYQIFTLGTDLFHGITLAITDSQVKLADVINQLSDDALLIGKTIGNNTKELVLNIGSMGTRLSTRYQDWQAQLAEQAPEPNDPRLPPELVDHRYEEVTVHLTTAEGRPMQGANLTLLSEPKEAVTDETGTAVFQDVPTGDHTLLIAFGEFRGTQKLFLNQDVPDLSVFVVPELKEGLSPIWLVAAFILGIIATIYVGKMVHTRHFA